MTEQNVSRRNMLGMAGAAVGGLVVGGVAGYVLKPSVSETVTQTSTVTTTATTTATTATTTTKTFTPRAISWVFPGTSDTERAWAGWETNTVNTQKPGNITSMQTQYIGWPDLWDKLNAMFVAGNPPTIIFDCDMVRWARLGKIQILDDLVANWPDWKIFRQPAVKSAGMYWKGHQLGVPIIQHAEVFNFRNDIVEQYWGKPGTEIKTWDDWLEAAEKINLAKPGLYAWSIAWGKYDAREIWPWNMAANGHDMKGNGLFNKDNHDKIIHSMEFMKKATKLAVPGMEAMVYKDTQVSLGSGQAAFVFNGGTWNYGNIEPGYPESCEKGRLTPGYYPSGPDTTMSKSWTSGCGDGIPSGFTAEQAEQAFEVIKLMHSPVGCAKFAGAMHVPARNDVSIDLVIENDWYMPKEKYRWWEEETYKIMDNASRLLPWYSIPNPDETSVLWYETISDFWKDKITVEQAYDTIVTKTKELWGDEVPAGGE
jgi:ABC-type glycerol-3-phosphate transport system substrate-binding protein